MAQYLSFFITINMTAYYYVPASGNAGKHRKIPDVGMSAVLARCVMAGCELSYSYLYLYVFRARYLLVVN